MILIIIENNYNNYLNDHNLLFFIYNYYISIKLLISVLQTLINCLSDCSLAFIFILFIKLCLNNLKFRYIFIKLKI